MPCLSVEFLSKQYHRHSDHNRTLKDVVTFALSLRKRPLGESDLFWALRNISFSIERGEIVGIIGRNGAGKSTLLRIIQGITHPTSGRIMVDGSVGSLLEVGTGFHPDLTGRENIFLSGAIMGLTRGDIRSLFDDIVSFAEIGEWINSPVKYYSSGMFMRLGFAVAVHCSADILLVDEALAVGDVLFQKKCFEKMKAFINSNKTILFVSHDLERVQQVCNRVIVLDNGLMKVEAPAKQGIEYYRAMIGAEKTIHCENMGLV